MMKRGTIKDKAGKTPLATTVPIASPSATTSKTGDKRQLPLDFSRHAVHFTGKKNLPGNATKKMATSQHHWKAASPSSSSLPASEPSVIRVNFAASRSRIISADRKTPGLRETEIVASLEQLEGVACSSLASEANQNAIDDPMASRYEDDDDDLARPSSAHLDCVDDDIDTESESRLMSVKTEPAELQWSISPHTDRTLDGKTGPENEYAEDTDSLLPPRFKWKTVYVAAFELALDTVLPEEAFLFTDEEHLFFETYRELPDDPKHLFVRLFLRKQKYWQRQCKLEGRCREIEDLGSAAQHLITVGLLMDQSAMHDPEEALVMLTMDELKILAKKVGIVQKLSGKQRQAMVTTILEHFRQQAFISKRMLLAPGGSASGEGGERKTGLATHMFSGDAAKRDNALIEKITNISGPCFKIYPRVMRVFERLHVVFHRSREFSDRPALLEAILAKIGQRTFPTYEITRTNTVFRNRDELLKYEVAIKLHFELSKMIETAMGPGRAAVVYVRDSDQANENGGANSHRRSNSVKSTKKSDGERINDDTSSSKAEQEEKDPDQERRRLEVIGIYERVIYEAENIRSPWREYVATETEMCKKSSNYFLLRFSPGYVYTQILRLCLRAFAFLKRFEEESILLHELLDQHIYSLGSRGYWYERLALIKSNYAFQKRLGKQEALQVCMMALRDPHVHAVDATLIQARIVRLESELKVPFRDRHDFSYLALRKAQTRILTGERLNTPGTAAPAYASSHSYSYVPASMNSSSHPIAKQRPLWRNIDGSDCSVEELALSYYCTLGYKGYHSENSILSTLFGLLFWDVLFSPQPDVFETSFQAEPLDLRTDAFFLQRQDMIMQRAQDIAKSGVIKAPAEFGVQKERTVTAKDEEVDQVLVHLERRRCPGNTEQDPVPNPSTANQDFLDSALIREEIKMELEQDNEEDAAIRESEEVHEEFLKRKRQACFYLDLIQRHDDLYREKRIYCVGVNWNFSKEELLEIAECIGGVALSEICKILAQEYSKRCSGMPDLCCWNYDKKLVKFVEVKGPGDRLSSKQQVWIDLLTSLSVDIELCIVQVCKREDDFLEERQLYN